MNNEITKEDSDYIYSLVDSHIYSDVEEGELWYMYEDFDEDMIEEVREDLYYTMLALYKKLKE